MARAPATISDWFQAGWPTLPLSPDTGDTLEYRPGDKPVYFTWGPTKGTCLAADWAMKPFLSLRIRTNLFSDSENDISILSNLPEAFSYF